MKSILGIFAFVCSVGGIFFGSLILCEFLTTIILNKTLMYIIGFIITILGVFVGCLLGVTIWNFLENKCYPVESQYDNF